jgi:epoxyqueuosine reductase
MAKKIPFDNFPRMVGRMSKELQDRYDPGSFSIASKQFEDSALLLNEFVKEGACPDLSGGNPALLSSRIKTYAAYLGAALVGITRINEETHLPFEGPEIGHAFAVAFAFPSGYGMVASAPSPDAMLDGWKTYGFTAFISVHLAAFIRSLGYPALGHHVRSHARVGRALCMVPIAIDAGLGELGRNGVLITRRFGPRVRIGVVTTSAPLIPDKPERLGVDEFCAVCSKCCRHCPTKAIGPEKEDVRGVVKWKVDGEKCIQSCVIQHECNICFRVCPWNREDTWYHCMLGSLAGRSGLARRVLLAADDLARGR